MLKKLFHVCFSSEDRQGRGLSARQTNEGIQTNVRCMMTIHVCIPLYQCRYSMAMCPHLPPSRVFGMVAPNPFIFLHAGSSGRAATAPWFLAT